MIEQYPGTASTPRVLCAWCDRVLREGATPASHGICTSCFAVFRSDLDTALAEPRLGRAGLSAVPSV